MQLMQYNPCNATHAKQLMQWSTCNPCNLCNSRNATYSTHAMHPMKFNLQCIPSSATHAVQPNPCNATPAMQSMQCNPCKATVFDAICLAALEMASCTIYHFVSAKQIITNIIIIIYT